MSQQTSPNIRKVQTRKATTKLTNLNRQINVKLCNSAHAPKTSKNIRSNQVKNSLHSLKALSIIPFKKCIISRKFYSRGTMSCHFWELTTKGTWTAFDSWKNKSSKRTAWSASSSREKINCWGKLQSSTAGSLTLTMVKWNMKTLKVIQSASLKCCRLHKSIETLPTSPWMTME
jgi:hypothetical protein